LLVVAAGRTLWLPDLCRPAVAALTGGIPPAPEFVV